MKRLFSIVQAQLDKAVDIQIEKTNPDLFKDFEAVKQEIRYTMIIFYSITKAVGDAFSGYNIPNFEASVFPERIETIFISTKSTFEGHAGYSPRNNIEVFLDFQRPRLAIDFITLPSNPTENRSIVNITGLEEAWVIESYDKLREFFDSRANNRTAIHKSGVYDAFLYTIIIPLFLYAFYTFEVNNRDFIDMVPKITIIVIYVYSFLIIGLIGRIVFQYARWLFPLVEYTSDKRWIPNTQRTILITLVVGIIVGAV